MKKEKSCGAVIFYQDKSIDKILLIKHLNGGHWSFPKGHVEAGETEQETACREILEETGVQVNLDPEFRAKVSYCPKKDVLKDVVYFIAIAQDNKTTAQESEIAEISWVPIADAKESISYKNDKIIIEEAIRFYCEKYKNN